MIEHTRCRFRTFPTRYKPDRLLAYRLRAASKWAEKYCWKSTGHAPQYCTTAGDPNVSLFRLKLPLIVTVELSISANIHASYCNIGSFLHWLQYQGFSWTLTTLQRAMYCFGNGFSIAWSEIIWQKNVFIQHF